MPILSKTTFTLEEIFPDSDTNPELFSTGMILLFAQKSANPKTPWFGHVSGDFESGEFCRVNDFLLNRLSNPDTFPPAIS